MPIVGTRLGALSVSLGSPNRQTKTKYAKVGLEGFCGSGIMHLHVLLQDGGNFKPTPAVFLFTLPPSF